MATVTTVRERDQIKSIRFSGFDGGLNSQTAPNLIKDNEVQNCRNVYFDEVPASITKRGGSLEIVKLNTTGRPGFRQAVFIRSDGTEIHVVFDGVNILFSNDLKNYSILKSGLNPLFPPSFVQFKTNLWIADGINPTAVWDGFAASITDVPAAPKGKIMLAQHNKLFIFNTDSDASEGRFSTDINPGGNPIEEHLDANAWPTDFSIRFNPDDGDKITGAIGFLGNVYIFKLRSTFVLIGRDESTFAQSLLNPRIGCISNEGLRINENVMVVPAIEAIFYFNGRDFIRITDNIERLYKSIKQTRANENEININNELEWNQGVTLDNVSSKFPIAGGDIGQPVSFLDNKDRWNEEKFTNIERISSGPDEGKLRLTRTSDAMDLNFLGAFDFGLAIGLENVGQIMTQGFVTPASTIGFRIQEVQFQGAVHIEPNSVTVGVQVLDALGVALTSEISVVITKNQSTGSTSGVNFFSENVILAGGALHLIRFRLIAQSTPGSSAAFLVRSESTNTIPSGSIAGGVQFFGTQGVPPVDMRIRVNAIVVQATTGKYTRLIDSGAVLTRYDELTALFSPATPTMTATNKIEITYFHSDDGENFEQHTTELLESSQVHFPDHTQRYLRLEFDFTSDGTVELLLEAFTQKYRNGIINSGIIDQNNPGSKFISQIFQVQNLFAWSFFRATFSKPADTFVEFFVRAAPTEAAVASVGFVKITSNEIVPFTGNDNFVQVQVLFARSAFCGDKTALVERIRLRFVTGVDVQNEFSAVVRRNRYMFVATSQASETNDLFMIIDKRGAWTRFSGNESTSLAVLRNERLLCADPLNPKIFETDVAELTEDFDGTDKRLIDTFFVSKDIDFGSDTLDKRVIAVYNNFRRVGNFLMDFQISFDSKQPFDTLIDQSGEGAANFKVNIRHGIFGKFGRIRVGVSRFTEKIEYTGFTILFKILRRFV